MACAGSACLCRNRVCLNVGVIASSTLMRLS